MCSKRYPSTKVKPSGSTSLSTTKVAFSSPVLVMVIVNVTSSPIAKSLSFATLTISKVTGLSTLTVAVLFLTVGSSEQFT